MGGPAGFAADVRAVLDDAGAQAWQAGFDPGGEVLGELVPGCEALPDGWDEGGESGGDEAGGEEGEGRVERGE